MFHFRMKAPIFKRRSSSVRAHWATAVGFGVQPHAAKFDDVKLAALPAFADLAVKNRPRRFQKHNGSEDHHERDGNGQPKQRPDDVDGPLD